MTPLGPDWQLLADMCTRGDADKPAPIALVVPIRIMSEANMRGAWQSKAQRVKAQRHAVAWAWTAAQWPRNQRPVLVRLVRLASREVDSDNLTGGFKAVRDEIACLCGFDDRHKGVRWEYAQEQAPGWRCRIEAVW